MKRILFVGDYSRCHRTLGEELQRRGHELVFAMPGCDPDTERRRSGKLGGLDLARRLAGMTSRLKGFDIVAINNPSMVHLRGDLCRLLFRYLKKNNKSIFLTAMGADVCYLEESLDGDSPLKYNDWRVGATLRDRDYSGWFCSGQRRLCSEVYEGVDGVASVLYEYDLACRRRIPPERLGYIGIPINTERLSYRPMPDAKEKVRFLLGVSPGREYAKGADMLLEAAREVVSRNPSVSTLEVVSGLPFEEYNQRLVANHVVLDQTISYSPATNALSAMALGRVAVSGGENDYYEFIGESENRPIYNALPDYDYMVSLLQEIVDQRATLEERGRRSREFVIKHNSSEVVGRRAIEFWTRLC